MPARGEFVAAKDLQVGDELISHDGRLIKLDAIRSTPRVTTVYNMRVADHHTYFVGGSAWRFDVWVHNAICTIPGVASLQQLGEGRYFQTAQEIRAEVATIAGLGTKYSRNAGTDGAGNIAFAFGVIDGSAVTIRAFAGSAAGNVLGFARQITERTRRLLRIPAGMGVDRVSDTEAKILGQLLKTTNKNSVGKITIYSEREACWSCNRAITRFTSLRPEIELHVRFTFPRST